MTTNWISKFVKIAKCKLLDEKFRGRIKKI